MNTQSNKDTAIIGLVAIVVIALAVAGTIAFKPKDTTPASTSSTASTSQDTTDTSTSTNIESSTASYTDGTYTASSSYNTPESLEEIEVTLTVSGGTISDVSIAQQASSRESREYQADFANSYKSRVVGKAIASLQLSRVSGSSLTSRAFNEALDQIRTQAQS